MKKGIINFILFIACMLVSSYAHAEYVCDLCTGLVGEIDGDQTVMSAQIIRIGAGSGSCGDRTLTARDNELAKTKYTGGNCVGGLICCPSPSCTMATTLIKCDTSWVANKTGLEQDISGFLTVDNVAFGNEKTVAETAFNAFKTSAVYPDRSSVGLTRTDSLTGYAYTIGIGTDPDTSSVQVDMWKRGGYAPTGLVTTLESIGGSSGSGGIGLSKSDTQDAVQGGVGSALTTAGLTGALLKDQMDAAFATAHSNGYIGPGGSGGVGMTGDALDKNGNPYTPSDLASDVGTNGISTSNDSSSFPTTYSEAPEKQSLTTTVTGFLSENPLIASITGSSLTVSGASCSLNGEVFGKTVTFDFCPWEDSLDYMGVGVLLLASIFSFYIIVGRA